MNDEMNSKIVYILDKFAKYFDYDSNQTVFNLLSFNSHFHKVGKNIEQMIEHYDNNGTISFIYAKSEFKAFLKDARVKLIDVIESDFSDLYELYDLFFKDADLIQLENSYMNAISSMIDKIIGNQIGERNEDSEEEMLFSHITDIVESINKLNIDVFAKSAKPVERVKYYSSKIIIFDTIAEAVMYISSNMHDGMYFVYVTDNNSSGGYFSFILKSNDNIVTINDRVNEAYEGQHKNSRNGRWQESKNFQLFPYNKVIEYSEHRDYLGYSTDQSIDADKCSLATLGPDTYIPILLSMIMINNRFCKEGLSQHPVKMSSAMLASNLSSHNYLMEIRNTALVGASEVIMDVHKNYDPEITTELVLSSGLATTYSYEKDAKKPYWLTGSFQNTNQEMVNYYGDDWTLDTSTLNKETFYKRLGKSNGDTLNSEFIGSYERMRMQSYMDARQQLADHMKIKIFECYRKYLEEHGDIKIWYRQALMNNFDNLLKLCAERYAHNVSSSYETACSIGYCRKDAPLIARISCEDVKETWTLGAIWLMKDQDGNLCHYSGNGVCPVTGCAVTTCFRFIPLNVDDIKQFIGTDDVPDVIRGWQARGHDYTGNCLLDAYDEVQSVGAVFEKRMARRYLNWLQESGIKNDLNLEDSPEYDFSFIIGLSKRGLNRLLKKYSIVKNKVEK